jgi:hypothetical protein
MTQSHIILNKNSSEWDINYITPNVKSKEWSSVTHRVLGDVVNLHLFNEKFCKEIIDWAEKHEWTKNRHDNYPTQDQEFDGHLGLQTNYNRILSDYVHQMLQDVFSWKVNSDELTFESFIVKYDTKHQSHLDLHHDDSTYSLVVTLNNDFEGGGTYFVDQKALVREKIGWATVHPGHHGYRHGGYPIESGIRYIIVTFVRHHFKCPDCLNYPINNKTQPKIVYPPMSSYPNDPQILPPNYINPWRKNYVSGIARSFKWNLIMYQLFSDVVSMPLMTTQFCNELIYIVDDYSIKYNDDKNIVPLKNLNLDFIFSRCMIGNYVHNALKVNFGVELSNDNYKYQSHVIIVQPNDTIQYINDSTSYTCVMALNYAAINGMHFPQHNKCGPDNIGNVMVYAGGYGYLHGFKVTGKAYFLISKVYKNTRCKGRKNKLH